MDQIREQKVKLKTAAAAAKSLQSCPTLCNLIDGSPLGSSVPGILQARTLEWVAISFSNAWKWKVKEKSLSCVRLLATPWSTAYQAPLSVGFSRQEYWSGVPLPSPKLKTIWPDKLTIRHIKICELQLKLWLKEICWFDLNAYVENKEPKIKLSAAPP